MFHQEYFWANRTQIVDELRRLEAGGFKAIFLTIDNTGIEGIRTRSIRFTGQSAPSEHASDTSLEALAELQTLTSLPIVPKGIRSATDAVKAMNAGFPAIYISNHGGRTIDGAASSLEIVLDIKRNAPEVFERMEVYADGGVRRGNHVLALLALGVRAVGMGRSPMFANIYGEDGVRRLIQMMKTEIQTTSKLLGVDGPLVGTIDESYVRSCCFCLILSRSLLTTYFRSTLVISSSSTTDGLSKPTPQYHDHIMTPLLSKGCIPPLKSPPLPRRPTTIVEPTFFFGSLLGLL